ncbi:MAG: tRNA (adenosine(37)-N6)-dimethylallyltransferase MiaA [Candidatus Omnitrophica bacterium]|nr:tRNA (adenosine(37)-N6)-dimethylallyltransferase MiaA [Candidatus Omnitrophota bacterium]
MTQYPRLICIVGPTASGKTKASLKAAKALNGEIISFDSMQIYKKMSVITQSPTKKEQKNIKHYFIEEIEPEKEYSAAMFRRKAEKCIKNIVKNGKTPILVGGTGLYLKALVNGLFEGPKKNDKLRQTLEKEETEKGPGTLYEKLKKIDQESAKKIHPNDIKRIIRAIEIYELTGKTKTEHEKNTRGINDKYKVIKLGIDLPRNELYERVNKRVDKMLRTGAIKEVKELIKKKLSITAKNALGVKELESYIKGDITKEKAKDMLKQNTRHYAKRQMTWFRADTDIKWFSSAEKLVEWVTEGKK